MQSTVSRCAFAEIEGDPDFGVLVSEYAAESGVIPGDGPDLPKYRALEAAGALHCARADVAGRLVGFVLILSPELPHYSRRVACTESIFVKAADRCSGAGIALIREAEEMAADLGCVGLFVSARAGSRLTLILARNGYDNTSAVYFKGLA